MWTNGTGGTPIDEKAVNGLDEDVITMSIEAARDALARAQIDPQEIRAVWVGSESHPYAVKPSSTIVAEAIGAVPNTHGGRLGVCLQGGHGGDAGGDWLCRLGHGQVRLQHWHGHGPGPAG
jgi:3-hydroxy-3-methylglutaryl CoA synthase